MKIKLLGSSNGDGGPRQFLISYLVDDVVAVDAGCIGFATPLDIQRRVEHVILSHSHIDHLASLPIFVDNVFQPGPEFVNIYGNAAVLDSLRRDIFNDVVWPNLERLTDEKTAFFHLHELHPRRAVEIARLRVMPIELDHLVPTLGFIAENDHAAVGFVSDTGPTDEIWDKLNKTKNLAAVFLECSFPNRMEWLAVASKHLTPAMFEREVAKLKRNVPIVVVHIKPAFHEELIAEIEALALPRVVIGVPGKEYVY